MKKIQAFYRINLILILFYCSSYATLEIVSTYQQPWKAAYLSPDEKIFPLSYHNELWSKNLQSKEHVRIAKVNQLFQGHAGPITCIKSPNISTVQTTIIAYDAYFKKGTDQKINLDVVKAGSTNHAQWFYGNRSGHDTCLQLCTSEKITSIPVNAPIIGLYSMLTKQNCFKKNRTHIALQRTDSYLTLHTVDLNQVHPEAQLSNSLDAIPIEPTNSIFCSTHSPHLAIAYPTYIHLYNITHCTLKPIRLYKNMPTIHDLYLYDKDLWTIDDSGRLAQYNTIGRFNQIFDWIDLEKNPHNKILAQSDTHIIVGNNQKTYLIKKK